MRVESELKEREWKDGGRGIICLGLSLRGRAETEFLEGWVR